MYYCPMCKAELSAKARFCHNCGFNSTNARLMSASLPSNNQEIFPILPDSSQMQPNTPPIVPSMPPVPTRSIQPSVKYTPRSAQASPAHSHTSTPIPPSAVPILQTNAQTPIPLSPQAQQFIRLVFPPPKEQGANTREISGQKTQLEPSHPVPVPQSPAHYALSSWPGQVHMRPLEQQTPSATLPPTQTSPLEERPTGYLPLEVVKGRPQVAHDIADNFDEGFVATSKAAEHWRTSWRNRQRSEAGPATAVSRGQSAVPEPLLAMQHSLMRIRAVVIPQRNRRKEQNARLDFWIVLFLLICLISGLSAYIASTYLSSANTTNTAAVVSAPTDTPLPGLELQGPQVSTISQGQTLRLQGDGFNIGAPIIFLLDGSVAINDVNGRQFSILTSNQGTFDAAVPTSTWSLGDHQISAVDNKDGQTAYLNIQITMQGAHATTSRDLELSEPTKLTFKAEIGQGNPAEQFVTLTNKNPKTALSWTATTTADDGWLIIDTNTLAGSLNINGKGKFGVSVNIAGLKSNLTPYTTNILFTITQTATKQVEQLILPVTLQVQNTADELIITPNPLVGILAPAADTCQTHTLLLLVNISNSPLSWQMNMSNTDKQHIQFMATGKPATQGLLAPAGQDGDTQTLTLACTHVHNGEKYTFTIIANGITWPETVSIAATP